MTHSAKLTRLSTALLALALLATLLFRRDFVPALSSDSLYIDDLWQSFFDGRGLLAWQLPPEPSFFPDLPLYGLSALFSKDLGLRHAIYALLEGLLLLGGTAMVCVRRLGLSRERAWLCASFGLATYILIFSPGCTLNELFAPAHHSGAMAASVWIFALWPAEGEKLGLKARALWALATAALLSSDVLVLAWGIVPALLLGWRRGLDRRWIDAMLLGILISMLGGLFSHVFGGPAQPHFRLGYFLSNASSQAGTGLQSAVGMLLREVPGGILAAAWFGYSAWRGERLLAWYSLLGVLFSLALLPLTGNVGERYFFPLYFFPAAFFSTAMSRRLEKILPLAGLLLAVVLAQKASGAGPQSLLAPYPVELQQLEAALGGDVSKQSGFADYWQARRLRMLSKKGLWIDPAQTTGPAAGDFTLYYWLYNANTRLTPHSYVVMNGLDAASIARFFGKPKKEWKFGYLDVWYYGVGMDDPRPN